PSIRPGCATATAAIARSPFQADSLLAIIATANYGAVCGKTWGKLRRMRIGIDLGGTKTEVAVLDDGGAFRLRRRVPTPAGDYDATIATIVALVDEAER